MLTSVNHSQKTASEEQLNVDSLVALCLDDSVEDQLDSCVSEWLYKTLIASHERSREQVQFIAQQAYLSINKIINRQIDAVLHHPAFKKLEFPH